MTEYTQLEIEDPINGAVFHSLNGKRLEGGLLIDVSGKVLTSYEVYVNGVRTERKGNNFTSTVVLKGKQTEITAISGQSRDIIRVLLDPNEELRYSLSFDDNIFFLWDILSRGYDSLFDNFYLRELKELHDKYGAKFTLNIFYKVDERYKGTFGPFSLNQFPDKFRDEWEKNSSWLRLAFHAFSEFPNRPYRNAPLDKITQDFDLVTKEILRFAGSAYIPTSITHWTFMPHETFSLLRKKGVRTLCGYFTPKKGDLAPGELSYSTNYDLNDKISRYLHEHKAVKDFDSGIVFCCLDLLFNATPIRDIPSKLDFVMSNPKKRGVLVFSTHEQYFWPQYKAPESWFDGPTDKIHFRHVPYHFQRLETGIKIATEGGYKSVFLHECYDL